MTSYYRNTFMVRYSTQVRHLITLFGQDVFKPFVSWQVMEVGVNSEMLHYNKWSCGTSNVLSYFKISKGYYMEKGSVKKNKVYIRKMNVKTSESEKKMCWVVKTVLTVNEKENKPSESYVARGFLNFF